MPRLTSERVVFDNFNIWKNLFFVILLSSAYSAHADDGCQHDDKTFRCVKYLKNYDGDTLTFDITGVHSLLGNKISVRVAHLDTPEIKGKLPCEKDAARIAQRLIENLLKSAKRIDLQNVERDKYFRILADVIVEGKSIKDLLMKNNLAYTYEGGTKKKMNWCNNRKVAGESP